LPPKKQYARFRGILVEPKTNFPPARTPKSILASAKLPQKLTVSGARMLAREMAELDRMRTVKERFARRMVLRLSKGEISLKEFNEKTQLLGERIQKKSQRVQSIMEKRAFLLGPRLERLGILALNDPFFDFLLGHQAFSEKVRSLFGNKKEKPVQTVAMVDMDFLKESNNLYGHVRGGAVLLRCYAEAAKEICEKHHGISARYGSDEFTFHFALPVNEVHAILKEYNLLAREKLMSSVLANAIKEGKIIGSATTAIIQVDFKFQERHGQSTGQIYGNIMGQVSKAVIQGKESGKRGKIITLNENTLPQR